MAERRIGERLVVAFPVRVTWKDSNGQKMIEEGLTENVGHHGALIYLPRMLPQVGNTVKLAVTDQEEEVEVTARVLRLERNAAHPQAALELTKSLKLWKEKVFNYAERTIAEMEPEPSDEW